MRILLHPEIKNIIYELRSISLCREGATIAVPSEENGIVDLDQLEDEARNGSVYAHMTGWTQGFQANRDLRLRAMSMNSVRRALYG